MSQFELQNYYYPIGTNPAENKLDPKQYAFRPTVFTSAALMAKTNHLLKIVKNALFVLFARYQ